MTNSMEQSHSGEANRFSARQEIFRNFGTLGGSSPLLQQPATCPYPKPDQSSLYLHIPVPEDLS